MILINGGISGVNNTPTASVGSGVWSLSEQLKYQQLSSWPTLAPTWNYNPMNTFNTYASSGSFVQSSTLIYLSGAAYDGGYKGAAVSPTAFKALKNNWNLDFLLNRDGVNSSPFPNFTIAIGRQSSASTYFSTSGTQDICQLIIGNNYNYNMYVYNGNNSSLYSNGGSGSGTAYGQYAVAGASSRISFNAATFSFTFYARTDGSFTSMNQVGTYTLTAGQKSSMESSYLNTDFYITMVFRANNDGWRNVNWYTV